MEFQNPFEESAVWVAVDEDAGSDEEEVLSFCDLVIEREGYEKADPSVEGERALHDSSRGTTSEEEDFAFFALSNTPAYQSSPVADLLEKGHHLHESESEAQFSYRKSHSWSESGLRLNKRLQSWAKDSADSLYSSRTSSSSGSSQRKNHSDKDYRRCSSASSTTKSKSKANPTSGPAPKPPSSRSKKSLKWQFFPLALMNTPPMKLEDIRLRQAKPYNDGAESSFSWKKEGKAGNFSQKSKCTAISVNGYFTAKKRVDTGGLGEQRGIPAKTLPFCRHTNSVNSGCSPKFAATNNSAEGRGHGDCAMRPSTAKGCKGYFPRAFLLKRLTCIL